MAQESRTQIKTYFQTGDNPTQTQCENLIDSAAWYDEIQHVWVKKSADQTFSTATLADITDFSMSVVNGGKYRGQALIRYTSSAATNGINIGISHPGGTYWIFGVQTNSSSAAQMFGTIGASLAFTTALASGTGLIIDFAYECTVGGTLKIQASSEVQTAGDTVTILQNSLFTAQKVN